MIRLALRQFRTAALVALGGVVALTAVVLLTRPHLVDLYDHLVRGCSARGDCDSATSTFLETDHQLRGWLSVLVVAVPGLIGAFWGAPLVARELETGTFRLAWTQSITRSRWLASKLAVAAVGTVATVGLVSLLVTWWADRLDHVGMDVFSTFDLRDVVPIGHALFVLALGTAAGVFIRRQLPAMATTVGVFIVVRLSFTQWLRPRLISPVHLTTVLDANRTGFGSTDGGPMTLMPDGPHLPNAWIQSVDLVDRHGRALTPSDVKRFCPHLDDLKGPPRDGPAGVSVRKAPQELGDQLHRCVRTVAARYHEVVTYQPAHRYWTLQWIELGVYVAGAVAVAGLCWWGVRRLR